MGEEERFGGGRGGAEEWMRGREEGAGRGREVGRREMGGEVER